MSFLKLDQVNLEFSVNKNLSIKSLLLGQEKLFKAGKTVKALNDISISLEDGDKLGIIGANGAGKSSLLKVMAGNYYPSSGSISKEGHISSLFELATGFEMEASGWDNIYLRGIMLGETPKTIKAKMQEIAEFSELGEHLNRPVKYYSSGMFIRLAFSVSTAIKPDILLLDEVMAAGDAHFLKKAEERIDTMMQNVKILVFVSHSMDAIEKTCNKCIWLENGKIKSFGKPKDIIKNYLSQS